jgi:hypothetical protein
MSRRSWVFAVVLLACGGKDKDADKPVDADTDTDTDADTDTDTDTDSDTGTYATPCDETPTAYDCYAEYREVWTPADYFPELCGFDGFDAEGRLVWEERHAADYGLTQSTSTTYSYDADGNLTRTEYDFVGFDGNPEYVTESTWELFVDTFAEVRYTVDGSAGLDGEWGTGDDAPADGTPNSIETYERNLRGELTVYTEDSNGDGTADFIVTNTYTAGTLSQQDVDEDADGTVDYYYTFANVAGSDVTSLFLTDDDAEADSRQTTSIGVVGGNITITTEIDDVDVDVDGDNDADRTADYREVTTLLDLGYTVEFDNEADGVVDETMTAVIESTSTDVSSSDTQTVTGDPYYGNYVLGLTYDWYGRVTDVEQDYTDLGVGITLTWEYGGTCPSPTAVFTMSVSSTTLTAFTDGTRVRATVLVEGSVVGGGLGTITAGAVDVELADLPVLPGAYTVVVNTGLAACDPAEAWSVSATSSDTAVTFDATGDLDPAACDLLP